MFIVDMAQMFDAYCIFYFLLIQSPNGITHHYIKKTGTSYYKCSQTVQYRANTYSNWARNDSLQQFKD